MLCLGSPVPTVIVRPFTVYGPGEPDFKLIPCILRAYQEKTPLRLTPGVHDFIHIEDFIRGLLLFAEMPGINDIVNLGTGLQYSNEEVANMFEKITEHKFERVYEDKGKIHDMDVWVCDPRYAQNKYGFKTSISLWDGLTKYANSQR
jgi:nucleoside-diphosphate-sugar epimerase